MISSPWIMIDLIVFDTPERARPLLDSFYACSSSNITEPDLEITGEPLPIQLGAREYPALRGVVWLDIDGEEAIDRWVQEQDAAPPFMVVMGYVDAARSQAPVHVWARLPGRNVQMVGDLDGDEIAALIGVEPRNAVESSQFTEIVVGMVLDLPGFDEFKAHADAVELDDSTPQPSAPSRSPRI